MDIDLILVKLEDTNNTYMIPANQQNFSVDIWTPWVDNQEDLERKSIIIAGSNTATSVGFCIFEHGGKLYVGADFNTKTLLQGPKIGGRDNVELRIEGHKISGQ